MQHHDSVFKEECVNRMGKSHSTEQRRQSLSWGESFAGVNRNLGIDFTATSVREIFERELKFYFALCGLSRSKSAPKDMSQAATNIVFKVRALIERSIQSSVLNTIRENPDTIHRIFEGKFYGFSKKQGVSVRFPLTSCVPTRDCSSGCYAHDVLDAAPNAVVRGALNGCVATLFEDGPSPIRSLITRKLRPHTRRAVRASLRELDFLEPGWSRRAYIRFAHVGEMSAYPLLADTLADQVIELSDGHVDCVVYTRHPNAGKLDPSKWIVNFTLDHGSMKRREWAPASSRLVYSAWDGVVDNSVEINFLEHHRWSHLSSSGSGPVCPATLPETTIRSCDAVQCDLCFRNTISTKGVN